VVAHGTAALPEPAPAFAGHLVRVRVDEATGEVKIMDYVAVQDVGFALNPLLVEGQIHGGIAQGIGLALREALVFDEGGQLLSGSFMDYGLPRIADIPHLETILLHNPSEHGAYGMRGIGEPPIIPGAAAIGNAIRDATGARLTALPMRPEAVWRALRG
jgi:CO/xanthine dehydrogenase Mo-binding subunit